MKRSGVMIPGRKGYRPENSRETWDGSDHSSSISHLSEIFILHPSSFILQKESECPFSPVWKC
jgi:hypothetical protein